MLFHFIRHFVISRKTGHQVIKITQNHNIKPTEKMSPNKIQPAKSSCNTCAEHEQRSLDILCKISKTLICKSCSDQDQWRQDIVEAAK